MLAYLNLLAQGTSVNTRIGESVRLRHLDLRIKLEFPATQIANNGTTPTVARVILFRWKISNGGIPTAAQILNLATAGGTENVYTPLNPDYFPDQFVLLHDQTYTSNPTNPTVVGVVEPYASAGFGKKIMVHISKNLKNVKAVYALGTTAVIASMSENPLFLWVVTDQNAASTHSVNVFFRSLVKYEDA